MGWAGAGPGGRLGAMKWFQAACSDASFRGLPVGTLILSDAPNLLRYITMAYNNTHAVDREALERGAGDEDAKAPHNFHRAPTARRSSSSSHRGGRAIHGTSARTWGNSFAAKLAAVIDAISAGLAREVQISRYSSMLKPAVARSMCTARVVPFDGGGTGRGKRGAVGGAGGVCPLFDVAFVRDLHRHTEIPARYACVQEQLASHPCKDVRAAACDEGFIAALA